MPRAGRAGKLSEEDAGAMTRDWELAAPADECTLVSLLVGWAARGRQASPEPLVPPLGHQSFLACF